MILVDLNVLLDVIQRREPHYRASAAVLERIVTGTTSAAIPAHAVTTAHFIVNRYADRKQADRVVDWLLERFEIAGVGGPELKTARHLAWADFEDAVVAASASSSGCSVIVTRNVRDFRDSPIPVMTPDEFLLTGSIQESHVAGR